MSTVATLLHELGSMVAKGEMLEALSEYYSEDCVFTEMATTPSHRSNRAISPTGSETQRILRAFGLPAPITARISGGHANLLGKDLRLLERSELQ